MASVGGTDLQFAFSTETDAGGGFGCAAANCCWWALEYVFITSEVFP
jgi:hypothetical protein